MAASLFIASSKGSVSIHTFVYYLMFYLSFTNAITVIASALLVIFEKKLKYRLKSPFMISISIFVIISFSVYASNAVVPHVVRAICSPTIPHDVDHKHVFFIVLNVFISAVILASYTVIFIYQKLRRDWEIKVYEIEGLKRLHSEAKFAALQSKVNPHFLFNTLNTILDLVTKSPKKVEKVILSLSDIYRRVLGLPDDQPITIHEEIELVQRYLEVEKVRLNERLEYEIAVGDEVSGIMIPPLLIQTLVENAVKHGISPKKEGGKIELSVTRENDVVVFCVTDNGVGIRDAFKETGFGLVGTQKRLQLFYHGKALFEIKKQELGGTTIRITIPYENENNPG